jgi:uncharacterized membrane protein
MFRWSARFRAREYIRCSLWVVPMLGGVAGVLLSWVSAAIDESVTLPAQWQYTQNTATTLLTTIVGAMVGLLGLVVTIGVLVVQQATSSLSPRFMRLWYSQRLQKAVLAMFAGTFAFAFGNLRRVSETFVPDVGVTLAGIACSGSLVMLLLYLDNFTHHLRPVAVASLVARRGLRVLASAHAVLMSHPDLDVAAVTTGEPVLRVTSPRAGAVQAVHAAGLLAVAERHDCTLVLTCSVGDFVATGVTVIEVYGRSAPNAEALLGCMAFGVERTIEQDPGFAMRILVDIAIRALSPAVNDPTTAVQILNHLETLLQALSTAPLPGTFSLDDASGRHRVVIPGRRWEDYLELGLTEIRQYGATSPQVCRRLAALLDALAESASPQRQAAVDGQRALLADSVTQNFPEPAARAQAAHADRQGIGGRWTAPTMEPDGQVGVVGRTSAG